MHFLVISLLCLLFVACDTATKPNKATTPPSPPSTTTEELAKNSPFPLSQLLENDHPSLSAALRERPWLEEEAVIQSLQEKTIPSWDELLSTFSITQKCQWQSAALPPESPFQQDYLQVTCFIPQREQANEVGYQEELELKGWIFDFLFHKENQKIHLIRNEIGKIITDQFQRELILSRLIINWLLATDATWAQAESEGAALFHQQEQQRNTHSQIQPLVNALQKYTHEQGNRPKNLRELAEKGYLVTPNLLLWNSTDDSGNPTQIPIHYFSSPLLLQYEGTGTAALLAAPCANADGSWTIVSSAFEIQNIPASAVQPHLAQ